MQCLLLHYSMVNSGAIKTFDSPQWTSLISCNTRYSYFLGMNHHKTVLRKHGDKHTERWLVQLVPWLLLRSGSSSNCGTRYQRLEEHCMDCSCPGSSSSVLWTVWSSENQANVSAWPGICFSHGLYLKSKKFHPLLLQVGAQSSLQI